VLEAGSRVVEGVFMLRKGVKTGEVGPEKGGR